jgi:1-deoxy-D-xylulose-5-phosphate reductoisomerase
MPQSFGSDYISSLPPSGQNRGLTGPRSLVVLGSTGSIGRSALAVMAEHPDHFRILGLAGGRNMELLARQAEFWRPSLLAVLKESLARELRQRLPRHYTPEILSGPDGYAAMARLSEAEMVLSAQVGAAGLPATLTAAQSGKLIALANKESLVLAGAMIRRACQTSNAMILPVDSEHNAVFQTLRGENASALKRIILTASGGPFRDMEATQLSAVTVQQALNHPNWSMGAKISVDSATLMNKGLEVIEACQLFGLPLEQVDVLIHPQSIVHSLVEFADRSLLAHLGPADMRVPISYCLGYPRRLELDIAPLDLLTAGSLDFRRPDTALFPCLDLARQALQSGQSHLVVLNAANEAAVELFLNHNLAFMDIAKLIRKALDEHVGSHLDDLEAILALSTLTRNRILDWVESGKRVT